ncbi:MAG: hypothetical protein WCJ69_15325 [Betaproteobacteria bacterium]
MARKLRLHIPAAFYHVSLRGNARQDIAYKPECRGGSMVCTPPAA